MPSKISKKNKKVFKIIKMFKSLKLLKIKYNHMGKLSFNSFYRLCYKDIKEWTQPREIRRKKSLLWRVTS